MELSKYEGDENDLGDFYSGKMILDDLFSTYNYFGSSLLNQWYFNKQKDVPYGFVSRIFEQTSNKKLVVHPSLIETVERNSTGKNGTYFNNFGLYVYQVLQNEDGMNSYNYTLEEKRGYFAILLIRNTRCGINMRSIWIPATGQNFMDIYHDDQL